MTEPVWLDGTQEPPPQPTLPDPLAGLLTGEVLPDAVPAPRLVIAAVPPPPPVAGTAITAVFAEQRQPRGKRQQPRQPAVGYRPQIRERQPRSGAGVVLITWLVTLFVLFLIARAVIAGVTGN